MDQLHDKIETLKAAIVKKNNGTRPIQEKQKSFEKSDGFHSIENRAESPEFLLKPQTDQLRDKLKSSQSSTARGKDIFKVYKSPVPGRELKGSFTAQKRLINRH